MTATHWTVTILLAGAFALGAWLGRRTAPSRPSTGAGADPAAPGAGGSASGDIAQPDPDLAPTGGGGRIVPR